MEYVEATHPFVARDDIGGGVTFRMPDVQTGSARVGKHVEDIKFWRGRIEILVARVWRMKNLRFVPAALPLRFELIEWIRFAALAAHRDDESGKQEKRKIKKLSHMTRLVIATRNAHKTREFAQLLGNNFEIVDLNSFPQIETIEETGQSFEENAITKAVHVSRRIVDLVVADDSGLEVDVLEGAPGVFSARYAGERASDEENVTKLLADLTKVRVRAQQPSARFRCVLALARNGRVLRTFEGVVTGGLAPGPRGKRGFGYDPVFIPNGFDRTFAELSPKVKNRISHRALAVLAR